MATPHTSTQQTVAESDSDLGFRGTIVAGVEELRTLQANWDGYGADPIDGRIIDSAKTLIRFLSTDVGEAPQVVPMTRGRLQFEWSVGSRHLELEFETPTTIHSLRWDETDGFEEERIQPNFTQGQAIDLIRWCLAGNGDGQS